MGSVQTEINKSDTDFCSPDGKLTLVCLQHRRVDQEQNKKEKKMTMTHKEGIAHSSLKDHGQVSFMLLLNYHNQKENSTCCKNFQWSSCGLRSALCTFKTYKLSF